MSRYPLHVRAAACGRRVVVCLLAAVAATGLSSSASAAEPRAEALFQEGRRLLNEGKLDEACARLAESQRLESSIGTLLNLGDCYERQGKLASAWTQFLAAAQLAGNLDEGARSIEGLRRAVLLEPRLSYLIIRVDPAARDVLIRQNGWVVGAEKLGVWLPVDPGEHVITAEAPGRATFRKLVSIERWGALKVEVPALEPEALTPNAPASTTPAPEVLVPEAAVPTKAVVVPKKAVVEGTSFWSVSSPRAVAGIAAGGVGLSALGLGVVYLLQEETTIASVNLGVGALSLTTGIVLFFWPTSKEKSRAVPADRAGVTVAPTLGGAVLSGRF